MFRLMHEMRVRIMTAPAFTGDKVIGTILFEGTMDGEVRGKPTSAFLWEERGVVPFVKVDKGLQPEKDGVQLLRPMPPVASPRVGMAFFLAGSPAQLDDSLADFTSLPAPGPVTLSCCAM